MDKQEAIPHKTQITLLKKRDIPHKSDFSQYILIYRVSQKERASPERKY